MNVDELFTPNNPQNFAFRPLTHGMVKNVPSQVAPLGSWSDLKGLLPVQGGLQRITPFRLYKEDQGTYPKDLPLRSIHVNWDEYGNRRLVLNGSRYVYKVDPSSGVTNVPWVFTPTTQGVIFEDDGLLYMDTTLADDLTGEDIVIGDDLVVFDGTEEKVFRIETVFYGDTTTPARILFRSEGRSLETIEEGTYDFEIRRIVRSDMPYIVNHVVVDGKTIFADSSERGLISYDASTNTIERLNAAQDPDLRQITCVDFFLDRLFIGGVQDEGRERRNRIRWTSPLDRTTFPAENYVDLPIADGEILRMKSLGPIHIVYCSNAIFVGRVTNYMELPVLYTQVDSGGIGLVGMMALTSWIDGHYFVGQDDIYYLSANGSVEGIGTPVLKETIRACLYPSGVYVAPDPEHERIVFGFTEGDESITKLWSFCYKQKAWSYDEVSCGMIGYGGDVRRILARDLTEPWREYTEPVGTWRSSAESSSLFIGIDGTLLRTGKDSLRHSIVGPVEVAAESNDIDFDMPDNTKTVNRLSFKVDRRLGEGEELRFEVAFSLDRGQRWTVLPRPAIIGAGGDEARVNFLATGSLFRFRLRSLSEIRSYSLSEFVVRWRPRGLEVAV